MEIADVRGDRGNVNLMALNKLPPFDLSSLDFFEKADNGADDVGLLDGVPRNNGSNGRICGVEMGGSGDSGRCRISGETTMSSTSNSSSSSKNEWALSVDIE